MFCSGSKSKRPNSSDELVPQALLTTYELIGCVGENSASCNCRHCHRFNTTAMSLILSIITQQIEVLQKSYYLPFLPNSHILLPPYLLFVYIKSSACLWCPKMSIWASKCFPFPTRVWLWKSESFMDNWCRNVFKTTLKTARWTASTGALTASVCHPPSPSASVQWELPWGFRSESE